MFNIFPDEIADGLQEKLSNNTVAFVLDLKQDDKYTEAAEVDIDGLRRAGLYHFTSILVSTGNNKNFDYFDPNELWEARETAIDKQINIGHNQAAIVGHIKSCFPVGQDEDRTYLTEVQDNFDLMTEGVIYTYWPKMEDYEEEVAELIEQIKAGEKFVSMEAVFPDFSYALDDGTALQVLDRTEATAKMSKYLKVYGGDGVYQGKKIYRYLKGIVFNGKGIVDNPANTRSVITQASVIETEVETQTQEKGESIVTPEEIQKELDAAKATVTSQATTIEELNSTIANLTEEVTTLKTEKDTIATEASAKAESVTRLEKELSEVKETIQTMKLEQVTAARVSAFEDKGYNKEEAKAKAAQFIKVDDETFAAILELTQVVATAEVIEEEIVVEEIEESATAGVINTDDKSKKELLKKYIAGAATFKSKTKKGNE